MGEVRDQLALAFDVPSMEDARRLADRLSGFFGVAKVGFELFGAAGPGVVEMLRDSGWRVFLDLKLHDIPTTVGRAARVLGGLGASYLNFHTMGGLAMVRAGAEGFAEGAAAAGHESPCALGVTVLTSDEDAPTALLIERAGVAREAGCGGVVCAATDLDAIRRAEPKLVTVVPGTRPDDVSRDDQARVATPREALDWGADLVVIGRALTASEDPVAAARRLVESLS